MEQLIPLLTGPASATVILAAMIWWIANKITPAFQKYLEDQNNKLEKLISALEKTVDAHSADRDIFKEAITTISLRLDAVEKTVEEIKDGMADIKNTMEK